MKKRNPDTLGSRLKRLLVQQVPDELAKCEFECSRTECSSSEWKRCPRRLPFHVHRQVSASDPAGA